MKRILFYIGALACGGTPAANPVQDGIDPGLLFHADWSTAIGTSDDAVRDTGKTLPWTFNSNRNGKRVDTGLQMSVEPNTLFPDQSFANMLRVNQYGRASSVTQGNLPIPAIGEDRYYRFYLYSDVGVGELRYIWSGNHPIELQFDNVEEEFWGIQWGHNQGDTVMTRWNIDISRAVYPNNVWMPGAMFERTVYRIEIHMRRTGDLSFTLGMRVYDGGNPGTLLFGNADFKNRDGSMTLADVPTHTYPNAQQWTGFQVGGNGELGDPPVGNTPIINGIFYYGGVCIRSDTWCGPYAGGI